MAGNIKNLKPPFSKDDPETARECGRKGAIKTNEIRRARKTLKEELLAILSNGNTQERMSLSILERALGGDVRAFEVIRDTIGEKPVDKVETTENVRKIFITKENEKQANKKIDDFINDL